MPQRAWNAKRERQYQHVKEGTKSEACRKTSPRRSLSDRSTRGGPARERPRPPAARRSATSLPVAGEDSAPTQDRVGEPTTSSTKKLGSGASTGAPRQNKREAGVRALAQALDRAQAMLMWSRTDEPWVEMHTWTRSHDRFANQSPTLPGSEGSRVTRPTSGCSISGHDHEPRRSSVSSPVRGRRYPARESPNAEHPEV